ncbi:MAG: CHASE2 domain-containing protein [Hyphomicrobiaceae bacterium]
MSEPGHFSLERVVAAVANRRVSFISATLVLIAALIFGREAMSEIPEIVEAGYGYDAQLRATHLSRSLATHSLPVTFVDVDDEALNAWGDATHTTPRAKIAALIERILSKNPAAIFVDFDLSGAMSSPGDTDLAKALDAYPRNGPPLLLTRALRSISCPDGVCRANSCVPATQSNLQSSPFEGAVAGNANMRWVSSLFAADGDGVVRSWRLWEPACEKGKITVIPSPQLAALALAEPESAGAGKLETYLDYAAQEAQGIPAIRPDWPKNPKARNALIPFLIKGGSQEHVSGWTDDRGFRYQRIRAFNLLHGEIAETAIKDRVVVLGASYGPDTFKTPFGTMPGSALIANAIAVAPAILNTQPVSTFLLFLISFLLATAYATVAKTLRAIPAGFVILALSYVWLSLATYWLNPADAVHTVSYALLMLGAFLAIESAIEILLELPSNGLSAVLKTRSSGASSKH